MVRETVPTARALRFHDPAHQCQVQEFSATKTLEDQGHRVLHPPEDQKPQWKPVSAEMPDSAHVAPCPVCEWIQDSREGKGLLNLTWFIHSLCQEGLWSCPDSNFIFPKPRTPCLILSAEGHLRDSQRRPSATQDFFGPWGMRPRLKSVLCYYPTQPLYSWRAIHVGTHWVSVTWVDGWMKVYISLFLKFSRQTLWKHKLLQACENRGRERDEITSLKLPLCPDTAT